LHWQRDTFYPQTLVLPSPKSSGRSVGIVRSRTQTTEFYIYIFCLASPCPTLWTCTSHDSVWFLVVACRISLYNSIHMGSRKSCANRWPVCALEICPGVRRTLSYKLYNFKRLVSAPNSRAFQT
jgi:hypothetical protein